MAAACALSAPLTDPLLDRPINGYYSSLLAMLATKGSCLPPFSLFARSALRSHFRSLVFAEGTEGLFTYGFRRFIGWKFQVMMKGYLLLYRLLSVNLKLNYLILFKVVSLNWFDPLWSIWNLLMENGFRCKGRDGGL